MAGSDEEDDADSWSDNWYNLNSLAIVYLFSTKYIDSRVIVVCPITLHRYVYSDLIIFFPLPSNRNIIIYIHDQPEVLRASASASLSLCTIQCSYYFVSIFQILIVGVCHRIDVYPCLFLSNILGSCMETRLHFLSSSCFFHHSLTS